MAPFILAFLFVFAVALAVVAAFALPHLRAGSPLLTQRGEQVAREAQGRLRRLTGAAVARIGSLRGGSGSSAYGRRAYDRESLDRQDTGQQNVGQHGPAAAGVWAQPPGDEPAAAFIQRQLIATPSRPGAAVPAPTSPR